MTPQARERLRAALLEAFGDTPAVHELVARYDVRPALVVAPCVPYATRRARPRPAGAR